MLPRITQNEGQIGFYWATSDGRPVLLADLAAADDEPGRLLPTHLEALDDALIDAAGRWGELLGGARPATAETERRDLTELHRTLDRLNHEFLAAVEATGSTITKRDGQIIGTSALVGIRARIALGTFGPTPLEGTLTDPGVGVVSGYGRFVTVDDREPWRGGRWIVQAADGRRFPLTLWMLLHDSSGVNKQAAVDEHRDALRAITTAAADPAADPYLTCGALDHLLHDWLMAHRESADSAAIEIPRGAGSDADVIIRAAAAGARVRQRLDPALFSLRRYETA